MIRYILWLIPLSLPQALHADEVYYSSSSPNCRIQLYQDKKLVPVDAKPFEKIPLSVKKLPRNPELVAFKFDEKIYVTPESCVATLDARPIELKQEKIQDPPTQITERPKRVEVRERAATSRRRPAPTSSGERGKFAANRFYVEFDSGIANVGDKNPVASDYNLIFPSTSPTDPTVWNEAEKSGYTTGAIISLGFGFRANANGFWAFKLRLISGKKTDTVELVDINTSISQVGAWTYADSFKNAYVGYKFIFGENSAWKPVIAAYIGASQMSSTISDGEVSYDLSSFAPAALLEGGVEYHFNYHVGVGVNLGYEHLGKRTLKFKDSESSGASIKTGMSYSNQYLSLGIKYYF